MLSHRTYEACDSPEPNSLGSVLMVSQKTSFINGKIMSIKFYLKYIWERMRIAVVGNFLPFGGGDHVVVRGGRLILPSGGVPA